MVVLDRNYKKPVKWVIDIKDSETFETKETYSMIEPNNNLFGLVDLSFNNPYGQIPTAYMEFHDPQNNIDLDKIRKGDIVLVQGTKDPDLFPYYNFSYTKIEKIHEIESIEGNMFYGFDCVGTAKILYDSIATYVKKPKYKNLAKGFANIDTKDDSYSIYNHLIDLLTKKHYLASPLDYNLQERGGFGIDEISKKVKEIYPSISKVYQKVSDIINEFADIAGCVWGVDEYNQIYFRHINDKTLGHILKTYKESTDDDNYTAVILDRRIDKTSSVDSNDGYFDIAYGFVNQAEIYEVGGDVKNYGSTWNKHLCVKVKAGTSRFKNLTLGVRKRGRGTSANDVTNAFLTGHIVNDDNGKLGNKVVAKFWHPITEIPENPANISVSITTEPKDIEVNAYYWIILHKSGYDDNNCLNWMHDNDISDTYTDHWSGSKPANEYTLSQEVFVPVGWQLTNKGPIYSYAFANYSNIPNIAFNPFSHGRGFKRAPVEVVYNVNFIKDVFTMQKFLNLTSFTGSSEPITLQFEKVHIPNVPIRSGYTAELISKIVAPKERGGILGTITNVAYKMTGRNEDDFSGPIGTNTCSVDFVGYFSQLDYKSDYEDSDYDY